MYFCRLLQNSECAYDVYIQWLEGRGISQSFVLPKEVLPIQEFRR